MVTLKLLCAAAAVAVVSVVSADGCDRSEHLTKSGYTSYDTDFTGNPKGTRRGEQGGKGGEERVESERGRREVNEVQSCVCTRERCVCRRYARIFCSQHV